MDPRIEPGTIVSNDSKDIIIYDRDVIAKLDKISASAFEILKAQLEEKRKALLSTIQDAESLESKSQYYSTKHLRDKFLENCRVALNNSSVEFPWIHIQKERLAELDATLRLINTEYDVIKQKVKPNLVAARVVAGLHDQLEAPLMQRIDTFKKDLIEALQNAATEYRQYLIDQGKWPEKCPEFLDKFGCIVAVIGSVSPYELEKRKGYGLEFGHQLRHEGQGFKRILIFKKEPRLEDIHPGTLATFSKDGLLSVYWLKNGKMMKGSLEEKEVQHIHKMLSGVNEILNNDPLIQEIVSKYACTYGELPKNTISIDAIKKMSLDDIEKMINHVIDECMFYSEDAYDVLGIIKNKFRILASKEEYKEFFKFKEFWAWEWMRRGYCQYLKSIILLKKEKELHDHPLEVAAQQLKKLENDQDDDMAVHIKSSLEKLQDAVHIFRSNVDKDIALIAGEKKNAIDFYSGSSEKSYKKIASLNANMQLDNDEAKTSSISVDTASHKVRLAYEDAIKFARLDEKKQFEKYAKLADESLANAKESMQKLDSNLARLKKFDKAIDDKLILAKQNFDGAFHRIPQAKYERESKKYANLKAHYVSVKKDFDLANILPGAIQCYGDFQFDCANATTRIHEADKSLAAIPNNIQRVWQSFNTLIDDVKEKMALRFDDHQAKVKQDLEAAYDLAKKAADDLALADRLRDQAMQKLNVAKEKFPGEIHVEHQETFDALVMQHTAAVKRYQFEEKRLASIRSIPQAMQEYRNIVLNTVVMQEEAMVAMRSYEKISTVVNDIGLAFDESQRLKQAGVIKSSLEEMSKLKLKEAEIAFESAVEALKKAEEIQSRERKALEDAKAKYPVELHVKPQEIFDVASNKYTLAFNNCSCAKKDLAIATQNFKNLQQQLVLAKQIAQEKQLATQLRQLLLKAILNNLTLWKPGKWGGGMDFEYDGKHYCIPHGVYELIIGLMSSDDPKLFDSVGRNHNQWIKAVSNSAKTRDDLASSWRYSLFSIRNDQTTGALYRAIKTNLKLDVNSLQSLHLALTKIPGLTLEQKHQTPVVLHR